jgi:hypothetical protein
VATIRAAVAMPTARFRVTGLRIIGFPPCISPSILSAWATQAIAT